jgi:hypothetical protein
MKTIRRYAWSPEGAGPDRLVMVTIWTALTMLMSWLAYRQFTY